MPPNLHRDAGGVAETNGSDQSGDGDDVGGGEPSPAQLDRVDDARTLSLREPLGRGPLCW